MAKAPTRKTKASRRRVRRRPRRTTWVPIDRSQAEHLTRATSAPGSVFELAASALPAGLTRMQGALSYFASGYTSSVNSQPGLTIGGKMLVFRTQGQTLKAYGYVFATSSDRQVYFEGNYKFFPGHHSPVGAPIAVSSLFDGIPFSPK